MPGLPDLEKRVEELEEEFERHNHTNVVERVETLEKTAKRLQDFLESLGEVK